MSTTNIDTILRRYEPAECGADGYPLAWRRGVDLGGDDRGPRIPDLVRVLAEHRCIRCGHPYRTGIDGPEWSVCDEHCDHDGPLMIVGSGGAPDHVHLARTDLDSERAKRLCETTYFMYNARIEAQWRVLTVHHLTGEKADCRWWNLVALCQRCHLQVQGRVKMAQVYPFEHTAWFKPYAAGWYAATYQGRGDITREEAMAELDELLALERVA